MDRKLNGRGSLNYLGVNAPTPPNLVMIKRAPTQNDYISFYIGDLWLNITTQPPTINDLYILVSMERNIATWVNFGINFDTTYLTGNDLVRVAEDGTGNINVVTSIGNLTFAGDPLTHTLTLRSFSGGPLLETITGTDNIPVSPSATGNINLTTATGGLTITNTAPNTLSIDFAGGGSVLQTVIPDQGDPTEADVAGDINFQGTLGRIVTTGDAATHIVNWDIGETVPTYFATDSADPSIPVVNSLSIVGGANVTTSSDGSNVITIDAIGLGASQFDANTGSAYPVNGIIKILGSGNIVTSASGNTITISSSGGGQPTLLRTTVFDDDATWTKHPSATRIVVYIWSGGGGGGCGARAVPQGRYTGGGGGGSGSLRVYEGPATASESIVVGKGGSGANNVRPSGADGGVSSFGAVFGYLVNNAGTSGINQGGQGNLTRGLGGKGWGGGNGGTGGQGGNGYGYPQIAAEPGTDLPYSSNATGGGGAGPFNQSGKNGGSSMDYVHLGGTGGNGSPATNGVDGFIGNNYSIGGTGGGGGGHNNPNGGNGGWPSGGGGGASTVGATAGNGGDGAVVVLEYDF